MIKITKNWFDILKDEFNSPYFVKLQEFLAQEYANYTVYPAVDKIFSALNALPFQNVKVVIIGQDPYHEEGQAEGLAFSVPSGQPLPPSLKNIYKELESDLGVKKDRDGSLHSWVKQGVLLLNTSLTVRQHLANSHSGKGWEVFTAKIISLLNQRQKPLVFILWGGNARKFSASIDKSKHFVIESAHPSPLSAYNGFFGSRPFSKTNEFLAKINEKPIVW